MGKCYIGGPFKVDGWVYKRCIQYTATKYGQQRQTQLYIEFSDSKFTLELAANATCQTNYTETARAHTHTNTHIRPLHVNVMHSHRQTNRYVCARCGVSISPLPKRHTDTSQWTYRMNKVKNDRGNGMHGTDKIQQLKTTQRRNNNNGSSTRNKKH